MQVSSISSFKWIFLKAFKSLGLVLVLIVFLTLLKNFAFFFLSPTSSGFRGLIEQKEIDILFIGSSHTKQSYDIRLIEKECDCSAYLLSYSGMDPIMMWESLNYLLNDKKVKVKNIIVESYAFQILNPHYLSDSRLFTQAPWRLKLRQLKSLFYEGKEKQDYKKIIDLVLNQNNESLLTFVISNPILNRIAYKGSYQNKSTAIINRELFNRVADFVEQKVSFTPNSRQIEAYYKIMQLNEKSNLLFIDPPMPKLVVDHPKTQKAMNLLFKTLSEKNYVYHIPWSQSVESLNHENFSDWNHLSHIGRKKYSKEFMMRFRDKLLY